MNLGNSINPIRIFQATSYRYIGSIVKQRITDNVIAQTRVLYRQVEPSIRNSIEHIQK